MDEENITHAIDLVEGYTDSKNVVHKHVVFGHRVTAKDLMRLDVDPQGQNPTQYQDLIVIEAITEFGSLEMKTRKGDRKRVSLQILLELDSIDREDLIAGCNEFQKKGQVDREIEISEKGATLPFGFVIGDLTYSLVEFGNRITGRDDVEADKLGLSGIARMCYLAGRQISKIRTADGTAAIDGPIELQHFGTLDGADVQVLRGAAELWRQSFRLGGRHAAQDGNGEDSNAVGAEAGGRPGPVAGKAAGAA